MRAVLWDLDGTLISTKRLYIEAYSRALRPYLGRELTHADARAVQVISELRFLRTLAGDSYEACLAEFRKLYAELHATHFDGIYEGVEATLAELRKRGLKLGVVTGKARTSWEVSRSAASLGDFDVVVLDDDVNEPKPNPEGILLALSDLGVAPDEAVYVGDSIGDISAANDAGVVSVAALWSKDAEAQQEFLSRLGDRASHIASNPADILDLIQR